MNPTNAAFPLALPAPAKARLLPPPDQPALDHPAAARRLRKAGRRPAAPAPAPTTNNWEPPPVTPWLNWGIND